MQWISLILSGLEGVPSLDAMRWWTNRGPLHSNKRAEETKLLRQCAQQWGQQVTHVWDRGFAGAPWIGSALEQQVRFILRWPSRLKLVDEKGHRNAWRITQGKRSQDHREIWDARRGCFRKTGIVAAPVTPIQFDQPLWLVVSQPGPGRQPWYLLTNEPVCYAGRGLAYCLRLRPPLADRDDLSLLQDRISHGESPAVVLGATPQAVAPGNPGLRFPVVLTEINQPRSRRGTVTQLVP